MDIEWKEGKIINTPLEGQMTNSYIGVQEVGPHRR